MARVNMNARPSSLQFGQVSASGANLKSDKAEPSLYWLNIGYEVEVAQEDGTVERKFVSLPRGVDLSTQPSFVVNSKNTEFAAFRQSQNELLAQLLAKAESLAWGETCIIPLQIELRKVNKVEEAVTPRGTTNPYVKKFNF